MTPEYTFTQPTDEVSTARNALARLRRHLEEVVDPLADTAIPTDLTFAILTLEDVFPPYPPLLEDSEPSDDPLADFTASIDALLGASSSAQTARDTLRYAYVIRDLRCIEADPAFESVIGPRGEAR
jgi:hypothetical protein